MALISDNSWDKITAMLSTWSDERSDDNNIWYEAQLPSLSLIFDEFSNLSLKECKKQLKVLEDRIKSHSNTSQLLKNFYLSFIEEMVKRRLVHHDLLGCECLIEAKVRSFLTLVKRSNEFPLLTSDEGCVSALVFSGKFIPLETYHANVTGVPRSLLFKVSFFDKFRIIKYVICKMGGFSPVLAYHLPRSMKKRFTVDNVRRDHEITADIFQSNKSLRSTFQASWFLDPSLVEISPHLAEIGRFVSKDGSLLVCIGQSDDSTNDAILKSQKRKKLYEEGKYIPKRYLRLWARKDILFWKNNCCSIDN